MVKALFLSIFGSAFFACLLTPPIYDLIDYSLEGSPWPFTRILDRVFVFVLLSFIIYFRKDFNLTSIRQAMLFPPSITERGKMLLIGFLITSSTVSLCSIGIFQGGILLKNKRTATDILFCLIETLPFALIISVIEELFFRVLFFKRLVDFTSPYFAVVISSLLYATVHFISPESSFVYHGKSWLEGFSYVPLMAYRLLQPGTALGILGLFVVGLLLSYAYLRIGIIYLAIGMHVGWITAMRMISYVSVRHPDVIVPTGLGGRYFLFSESWTWLSFAIVATIIALYPRYSCSAPVAKQQTA